MNTDAMKPILPFQGEGIEVRSYTQGVGLSLSKTAAVSSVERRCRELSRTALPLGQDILGFQPETRYGKVLRINCK
jgi:hypothetical protein